MQMKLQMTNKKGEVVSKGKMEIRNQSEGTADLFIYGDIISDSWYKWTDEDTCPQDVLDFLSQLDDAQNINVYINSGGGSVWAGIAIYQQLKMHHAKKTVYIDGIGASIASVIAMAADELIMPEGSMLMIHKPMNGYFFEMLNADQLRKDADTLDRVQENIVDIYMTKAAEGVCREDINAAINDETWMNTEKAQEYFDVTTAESKAAAACDSAYFNRYCHAPQSLRKKEAAEKRISEEDAAVIAKTVAEKILNAMDSQTQKNKLLADLGHFGA